MPAFPYRPSPIKAASLALLGFVVGGFLAAASPAVAAVDGDSLTDEAEIIARAFDGAGTSAVTDRAGLSGFSEFLQTVDAADSNADSGRSATASAFQDTEIVRAGDELLGLDSRGTADAAFNDTDLGDSLEPLGTGSTDLTIGFEVTGEPVQFSLIGELDADAASTSQCTEATVTSPSGTVHDASSPAGCGSPGAVSVDETGELRPGFHQLTVNLVTSASGGNVTASGTASASYDLALRFCTITAEPAGITNGTPGDDVICGSSAPDIIGGRGGEDRILGLGDEDLIEGGPGDDEIDGGAGDDLRLYGGPGNDIIDGGPGNDGLGELSFEFVIAGGPGDDELIGGAGADRLVGRCLDLALGSPSPICPDDPITAGETDDDNLTGGAGDDILFADAGSNFISGGPGNDTTSADGPSVFLLGGGNDSSLGGAGSDEIDGGSGKDLLEGERGNDCLVGGSGEDDLLGDDGKDKLLAKDGRRDKVSGGAGADRGRFDPQDRVTSVSGRNLQGGC